MVKTPRPFVLDFFFTRRVLAEKTHSYGSEKREKRNNFSKFCRFRFIFSLLIFDKINKELQGLEFTEPTKEEIIETVLEHAKSLLELVPEHVAIIEMRTHAVWYFKQLPNSKQHRLKLVQIKTYKDLETICLDYLAMNN